MRGGWACLAQPDGCACHCHKIQAARRANPRPDGRRWTAEQDDALRSYLKRSMTLTAIVAALNARFKTERTLRGVRCHISDIGLSTRQGWFSRRDVERCFSVNHRTISRWITTGALPARRHVTRYGQPSRWWEVTPEDLHAFVDAQAGVLFTPRSVVDPALRARAELAATVRARRAP